VPALVCLVHPLDGQYPGGERGVAGDLGLPGCLLQRPGRGRVPPGLQVDDREFAQNVGCELRAACRPGRREGLVQHHSAFAIQTAYRVHERGAQGRQDFGQHLRVAGTPGFAGRLPQGLDACVG
jgi:hypothetical protein